MLPPRNTDESRGTRSSSFKNKLFFHLYYYRMRQVILYDKKPTAKNVYLLSGNAYPCGVNKLSKFKQNKKTK